MATVFMDWLGLSGPIWLIMVFVVLLVIGLVLLPFSGIGSYIENKTKFPLMFRVPFYSLAADRALSIVALLILFWGAVATIVVIPFTQDLVLADLNIGILYFFTMISLFVVGLFFKGFSQGNRWVLLGGMRSTVKSVSYQIPMVLSVIPVVLVAGSLSFGDIVNTQSIYNWNFIHNPFCFFASILFFVSFLGGINRSLLDVPETEAESDPDFNLEHIGVRSVFLVFAEYSIIFVICAASVVLYFGGWHLPIIETSYFVAPVRVPIQIITFIFKTLILIIIVLFLRWTLPRFRVDQVLNFSWRILTPVAFLNFVGAGIWVVAFRGRGILELLFGL
ncbi:NADH-quinone oxidoreductase subunit H [Bdellovibrionota bacterium]